MTRYAAVLALVTAACASGPIPTDAQRPQPELEPPTIHVTGHAAVTRAPDVATIELAVETEAPTARAASEQNAERMAAVLDALLAEGVDRSSIRTRRLELHPRHERRRDRQTPELIGYRALNQVSVRLHDVDRVGEVVDAAVAAGANRVTGIHFELSDSRAAYHEALREAIDNARAEAEAAADALGLRLAAPLQVSTGGFRRPTPRPMPSMRAEMEMAAPAPPVEPGEVEVEATVSIVWRLEP